MTSLAAELQQAEDACALLGYKLAQMAAQRVEMHAHLEEQKARSNEFEQKIIDSEAAADDLVRAHNRLKTSAQHKDERIAALYGEKDLLKSGLKEELELTKAQLEEANKSLEALEREHASIQRKLAARMGSKLASDLALAREMKHERDQAEEIVRLRQAAVGSEERLKELGVERLALVSELIHVENSTESSELVLLQEMERDRTKILADAEATRRQMEADAADTIQSDAAAIHSAAEEQSRDVEMKAMIRVLLRVQLFK